MMNNIIIPKFNKEGQPLRNIRSFVCRYGPLTKRQKFALDNYWFSLGVDFKQELLNLKEVFGRSAPLILEIGFGMSTSLINTAINNPHQDFLGIEVYTPGVATCLAEATSSGVNNLRVIHHDAVEVFQNMIPDNTIHIVQLFFPDPWFKRRHNKRRIIQIPFTKLVVRKLKIDGIFHIVTDCKEYVNHILSVMGSVNDFVIDKTGNQDFFFYCRNRPCTKFEQRAHRLGNKIWELIFKKIK